MLTPQEEFLLAAHAAAISAQHIFPDYAAAECALESAWGKSQLARVGRNLFGRKSSTSHPSPYGVILLPTKEYLHGEWVTVQAAWVSYPSWEACFRDRMELLRRLPHLYGDALAATDGETFVREVSRHWSTDPRRADKVLAIFAAHKDVLQTVNL